VARLGRNHLEKIWEFVTDATADLYARHAAVAGVLAMHHLHPERRVEAVAFLQRLLSRTDVFPVDHLAGILCDCADSGLTEMTEQAKEFAARMDDDEGTPYPMATADDVRKAFRDGAQAGFISGRPHDVYAVNRRWQIWAERQEQRKSMDADEPGVASSAMPVVSRAKKVGRNDPCPCGSGKKYKKCHGM
ncbi:MAG: SEC-C metal-binding domain-containing protein, partial [Bacteroidota bacterium]